MSIETKQEFVLYIDDSGNRYPDKQDPDCRADGMDHFALGGVLMKESDKDKIEQAYKEFCKSWSIDYPLHSTKIRGMRSDFAWLEESSKQKDTFYAELESFLILTLF